MAAFQFVIHIQCLGNYQANGSDIAATLPTGMRERLSLASSFMPWNVNGVARPSVLSEDIGTPRDAKRSKKAAMA